MLIGAENMGYVRHPGKPAVRQRIALVLFTRGNTLARKHNRTEFEGKLFQVREIDVGFEGPHAASLIFADHKFEVVLAQGQAEAGGVLDILARNLLGIIDRETRFAGAALGKAVGTISISAPARTAERTISGNSTS